MNEFLPGLGKARLLVAGDVMLDRYISGATQRISPEAPVPVVRVLKDEVRPGGAANVALNVAALGATVELQGFVGQDAEAQTLESRLTEAGVTGRLMRSAQHPTITKLRVLSRNQQLIRLDFEAPLAEAAASDHAAFFRQYCAGLKNADVVLLSDYGKGTLAEAAGFVAEARRAGKPVLIDPKGVDYRKYAGATLLTPNVSELEAVVGPCPDAATLVTKGQRLLAELDLQGLLVTRSEKGMTLLRPGQEPLHLPAVAREVFDVTGAGDTVIAVLATVLAAGADLAQGARLANVAAGIVVGKLGAASVSRDELLRELQHTHADDSGVLSETALMARVHEARARGETIVMTNGCFDLLHVGHLRYLEAARRLGNVLIVAVNADASVQKLKGPKRPLNPLADRMRLLAAIKGVDWVVPFSEDTPERLIGRVLPDKLVKGGDYRPEQVAGHEAVIKNGGEVVILDFHQGYSTTSLIERAGG